MKARATLLYFIGLFAVVGVRLAAADVPTNGTGNSALSPFIFGSGGNASPAPNPVPATEAHLRPVDSAQVRILRARLDGLSPSDPNYAQALRDLETALGMPGNSYSMTFNASPTFPPSNGRSSSPGDYASSRITSLNYMMSDAGAVKPKKPTVIVPLFTPVTLVAPMTISLTVGGAMDPWLAGMPVGTHTKNDNTAPENSPVFIGHVTPGQVLTFVAVNKAANVETTLPGIAKHLAENGLAGLEAPFHSLAGVFLDDSQPDKDPPPEDRTYATSDQIIRPGLRQVFSIGDGRTSGGATRQFIVPAGATRLFLGATNSNGLSDQLGQFGVIIEVPRQPSKLVLWLVGGFFALLLILIFYIALRNKSNREEFDAQADETSSAASHPEV